MAAFANLFRPSWFGSHLQPISKQHVYGAVFVLATVWGCAVTDAQSVSVSLGGPQARAGATTLAIRPQGAAGSGMKTMAALPMAARPVFSLGAGHYYAAQSVSITDSTPGATIYYTTDGSTPTTYSTAYTGPVSISTTGTLVAFAVAPGYAKSDAAIATYYIGTAKTSYVYTVAGTDFWGYEGDGGPATQAVLNSPYGVAADGSGNLYIADTGNNLIRKIDASTGNISNIAGTGTAGYSGDGGPAVKAELNSPGALAMDSVGALYVTDAFNSVVRRINLTSGTITTYAGNPNATALGDGGPATSAQLSEPMGIAFDAHDNLYIGSLYRIRMVNAANKTISTVAGMGYWGSSGDGGQALNATMTFPTALAVDSNQMLYFADEYNDSIRRVNLSTGIIDRYAGMTGNEGYSGDGGPATSARLSGPSGLAVDPSGNLYIADGYNVRIRKVNKSTGVITTAAGSSHACFLFNDDGSPATSSALCLVTGLSFDSAGNLYIAEGSMSRVKKMTAPVAPPTTFAATPVLSVASGTYATPQTLTITDSTPGAAIYLTTSGYSPTTGTESYHGPFEVAASLTVTAIAVAPGYMPSKVAKATYTITASPAAVIKMVAGNGIGGFSGAGGPATSANMQIPYGLALDSYGNGYICDSTNNVVWKVDGNSGNITLFAGTGHIGYSGDGGPANQATLTSPGGVAVDSAGDVFIADTSNDVIREVTVADGKIKTVAGNGTNSYSGDDGPLGDGGPATQAMILYPNGVAVAGGDLYIADENNLVRRVTLSTGIIDTVAGDPLGPPATDGAVATSVSINGPTGLAADAQKNVYFGTIGQIWKLDLKTGLLAIVAGNGNVGTTGDGDPALEAQLAPQALAVDRAGNIYISEFDKVRKVDANTGVISRLAGIDFGGVRGGDSVPALVAGLCPSAAIALDAGDNVYVGDSCQPGVFEIKSMVPASAPNFSAPGGTYQVEKTIKIIENTPEATIYYTLDGSAPSATSAIYTGPITLTSSATLTAVAVAPGFAPSAIVSARYTITPRAVTCCTPISPGPLRGRVGN